MNAIETLTQHLVPATLVVARVSGLAIHGPVLSSPAIPMRIKALLVAALGLAPTRASQQHRDEARRDLWAAHSRAIHRSLS